jgi:hypothetical protein|tara:strand:- start:14379 stop:15020 length:642 start_codon:yes stop_codon:yes gene_type:complete
MGYLDKSTVTVDAILTKRGRQLLAQGDGSFQVAKFAVADDEINYDLWDTNHSKGTSYYGQAIENMPMTEAVPSEDKIMRYKLMTLPKNTLVIPTMTTAPSQEVNLSTGTAGSISFQDVTINIFPSTITANQFNVYVSDVSVCYIGTGVQAESQTIGSKNYLVTNNSSAAGGSFRVRARILTEARSTTVTVASVSTGNVVQLQVNVAANPILTA